MSLVMATQVFFSNHLWKFKIVHFYKVHKSENKNKTQVNAFADIIRHFAFLSGAKIKLNSACGFLLLYTNHLTMNEVKTLLLL